MGGSGLDRSLHRISIRSSLHPRPSRASLSIFPQWSLDFGQDVSFRAIFLPKRQASVLSQAPSALSPRRRFPREPQPECCLRLEGQDRTSEPRPGAHGAKQRHQDKLFFPRPTRLASPRLLASYVCGKDWEKEVLKLKIPGLERWLRG